MNKFNKYNANEILQILIDLYYFQSYSDSEVVRNYKITFNTKIAEWRRVCDLIEAPNLALLYCQLFQINDVDVKNELIIIISNENENTLKEFCEFISIYASKKHFISRSKLGSSCLEGDIFITIRAELEKKGIDVSDFKPSTPFIPFFMNHGAELVPIISLLAPGTLIHYRIKEGKVSRISNIALIFSISTLILILIYYGFNWISILNIILIYLLFHFGNLSRPDQYEVGGFNTIRELITAMASVIRNKKD